MSKYLAAALILSAGSGLISVHASGADRREQLLQVLRSRPRGMSADAWREQRREAARELGRQKERRAVPDLLRIIATERFDVILELAIDALGNIGDKRAIEPLRRLLDDPSLDAYVRDAAANALKKLAGTTARSDVPRSPPKPRVPRRATPPPSDATPPPTPVGQTSGFEQLPPLELAPQAQDLLARSEALHLAAGTGRLDYSSATETAQGGLSLATRYRRQLERKRLGYTVDGNAGVDFTLQDQPNQDNTWHLNHDLQVAAETRYYPFRGDAGPLFGQLSGGFGYGFGVSDLPFTPQKRFVLAATPTVAGGVGWGRIYDVGPRLRLRRLTRILRKAGVLRRAPTPRAAAEIMDGWYQLRNHLGQFKQLGYTLKVLQSHGVLDPPTVNAATLYRLIRVLDDAQLDNRQAGLLVRGGFGYSRVLRRDADDTTATFAYATAELSRQRRTTRAVAGRVRFFYDVWQSFFAAELRLTYQRFLYNRAFDPLGAMALSLTSGLNNQPGDNIDGFAHKVLLGASYARHYARGTRILGELLSGQDNGAFVIMLSLSAEYGVASGATLR